MGIFGFSNTSKASFPWKELTSIEQLQSLLTTTEEHPLLLFKHSTRCSISSMALNRFENEWEQPENGVELYYLDLLNYRAISNEIERLTGIEHQSPQAIVIKNGEVIYNASHSSISAKTIIEQLKNQ